jgi:hypothetical protein
MGGLLFSLAPWCQSSSQRSLGMKTHYTTSDSQPVKDRLTKKLHPSRHPTMSSRLAAVVGFIVGSSFGSPPLVEMAVTSDRIVLVRPEGSASLVAIGRYDQILFAWLLLLDAAGLTKTERMEAACLFAKQVGYFGLADA